MLGEKRICIVGLGLMGGSLARALHAHSAGLVGVDTHAATRQAALQSGLFERVTDDVATGTAVADAVILATPVGSILHLLSQLPQVKPDGCLLLDLGSTKSAICEAMAALPAAFAAMGGHPMCGKETAGFAAADPHLYQNQTFVLCRHARTTETAESFALDLIAAIGAMPLFLDPADHDRLVAAVSHLPYLASAALMRHAAAQEDDRLWPVSASGFRDTTRLAGSDPRMMLDILLTNKTAVLQQLEDYQSHLASLARLLEAGDEKELAAWLAETQNQQAAYRKAKEESGSREP